MARRIRRSALIMHQNYGHARRRGFARLKTYRGRIVHHYASSKATMDAVPIRDRGSSAFATHCERPTFTSRWTVVAPAGNVFIERLWAVAQIRIRFPESLRTGSEARTELDDRLAATMPIGQARRSPAGESDDVMLGRKWRRHRWRNQTGANPSWSHCQTVRKSGPSHSVARIMQIIAFASWLIQSRYSGTHHIAKGKSRKSELSITVFEMMSSFAASVTYSHAWTGDGYEP